ncbi:unnamed protein product [Rangifer tarandus platyrhynchus]|uniref:Uncharacterized protein n=1 Tax=Rangifer tarandus platyrhynchus TaxID=3082113 RepID=A0AC60A5R8_RANTA
MAPGRGARVAGRTSRAERTETGCPAERPETYPREERPGRRGGLALSAPASFLAACARGGGFQQNLRRVGWSRVCALTAALWGCGRGHVLAVRPGWQVPLTPGVSNPPHVLPGPGPRPGHWKGIHGLLVVRSKGLFSASSPEVDALVTGSL